VRTGILGGTFDPIHVAHLHTAECALFQLSLDRVLVMPAGDPWQKLDREVSPSTNRLEMCRIALAGIERIELDDREVGRQGPSYTIDTLESFPVDEELFLIVGSDAAAGLDTWHRWDEIIERVSIVVAPRPGAVVPDLPRASTLDMGLLDVRGTDIRERARTGRPYRFLVTQSVYQYIQDHDLYANRGRDDMVGGLNSMESSS